MVYFVQIPDGRIKIGTTYNFGDRMSGLGKKYGKPIVVLALIPGWEQEEGEIHRCFCDLRYPRTELFDAGRRLVRFIANLPEPVVRDYEKARRNIFLLDRIYIDGLWRQKLVRWSNTGSTQERFRIVEDPVRGPVAKIPKVITMLHAKAIEAFRDQNKLFRALSESIAVKSD